MAIIQSPIRNLHLRRRVSLFDKAVYRPVPRSHVPPTGRKTPKLEVRTPKLDDVSEEPAAGTDGHTNNEEDKTTRDTSWEELDAQERAWRTLHSDESGLLRIRNEPSCDYNWRRTASEEVLDTPGLTDDLPLADGDLRIHVSPAGMQVWAVGVDMWDDQRAWTLAKEGQAHPTLDDYVLTFLGDRYMPRWVKRHTYATYKSNHKAARK